MTELNQLSESASTAADVLRRAAARLSAAGVESARLNAEVLLAAASDCSRTQLLARLQQPIAVDSAAAFADLLRRRLEREPLQYIVGSTELWSLDFDVTPDVLIPRPETERIVELTLSIAEGRRGAPLCPAAERLPQTICDVGTGSGCIAIALARELPGSSLTAVDISVPALRIAALNAARHRVAESIRFVESDLFEALRGERFDVVVSNPPYVATEELESAQPELAYEPRTALDGGADGLEVIRELIRQVPGHLRANGWLFVEIGCDQGDAVVALAGEAGARVAEVVNDHAGLARVLRAQW